MLVGHLLFAFGILIHQAHRVIKRGADTQVFIAAGFFAAYGVFPLYLSVADMDEVFASFGLLFPYSNLIATATLMAWPALFLSVLAYIVMCIGFDSAQASTSTLQITRNSSFRFELSGIVVFLTISVLLAYYIYRLGGMQSFLSLSMFMRSDVDTLFRVGVENVAFLKNVCRLMATALILAFVASKLYSGRVPSYLRVLQVGSIVGVILIMVHSAGRLDIGMLLFAFVVAEFIGKKRVPWVKVLLGVIAFAAFVAVGKELFWMLGLSSETMIEVPTPGQMFHRMMLEIAFPYFTITTAIAVVPELVDYRYFVDIPLAIANLTPASLMNYEKFRIVSEINTEVMNTGSGIPVDLVGFGYYSAGPVGVIIWALAFGRLAGYLDRKLADPGRVLSFARATVALTFGQRVLYSEPSHILNYSLHVIVAVVIVLWATRRQANDPARDTLPNEASPVLRNRPSTALS